MATSDDNKVHFHCNATRLHVMHIVDLIAIHGPHQSYFAPPAQNPPRDVDVVLLHQVLEGSLLSEEL
ncbi:hypothetical protein BHE74_00004496 [Ensete ventricosum]|nr:hypothetical protein BHE74_00004496 [Ensete ventricosum]